MEAQDGGMRRWTGRETVEGYERGGGWSDEPFSRTARLWYGAYVFRFFVTDLICLRRI